MSRNCIAEKYGDKYPGSPLNSNSTHPNPFKNPDEFEVSVGIYNGFYRIYKGHPTTVEPVFNFASDGEMPAKLWYGFRLGLKFGIPFALFDIMAVRKIHTPVAIAARMAYITVPLCGIGMSYFVSRDILGNVSKYMGGKKDETWTFAFAPSLGPAAVTAVWLSFRSAYLVALLGGVASLTWKKTCDWGHNPWDENLRWKSRIYQTIFPADAWKWKGMASYDEKDPGPAWKKFDEEDQKKMAAK